MPKKLTTEQFIMRANKLHNHKYNYSKSIYTGNNKELIIICTINDHGEFNQLAGNHINNSKPTGCPKCGNEKISNMKKIDINIFKNNANEIHNYFYDYDYVKYIDCDTHIIILCRLHGFFNQTPYHHVNRKRGCPLCGIIKNTMNRRSSSEIFKEKSINLHSNKFTYEYLNYIDSKTIVTITCVKHGNFEILPSIHLNKQGSGGCKNCKIESNGRKLTKSEFEEKAYLIHGNTYNYINVKYVNGKTPVEIICKIHGSFLQKPSYHIYSGTGCKKCTKTNYSKIAIEWLSLFEEKLLIQHANNEGEYKIILQEPTLFWKKYIAIDGYCKDFKLCFEFDGCLFHGCNKCYNMDKNPLTGQSMKFLFDKTITKHNLIKSLGYNLITIKECEYKKLKSGNIDMYIENIFNKYINTL